MKGTVKSWASTADLALLDAVKQIRDYLGEDVKYRIKSATCTPLYAVAGYILSYETEFQWEVTP